MIDQDLPCTEYRRRWADRFATLRNLLPDQRTDFDDTSAIAGPATMAQAGGQRGGHVLACLVRGEGVERDDVREWCAGQRRNAASFGAARM